jgi:hypothetical protein
MTVTEKNTPKTHVDTPKTLQPGLFPHLLKKVFSIIIFAALYHELKKQNKQTNNSCLSVSVTIAKLLVPSGKRLRQVSIANFEGNPKCAMLACEKEMNKDDSTKITKRKRRHRKAASRPVEMR